MKKRMFFPIIIVLAGLIILFFSFAVTVKNVSLTGTAKVDAGKKQTDVTFDPSKYKGDITKNITKKTKKNIWDGKIKMHESIKATDLTSSSFEYQLVYGDTLLLDFSYGNEVDHIHMRDNYGPTISELGGKGELDIWLFYKEAPPVNHKVYIMNKLTTLYIIATDGNDNISLAKLPIYVNSPPPWTGRQKPDHFEVEVYLNKGSDVCVLRQPEESWGWSDEVPGNPSGMWMNVNYYVEAIADDVLTIEDLYLHNPGSDYIVTADGSDTVKIKKLSGPTEEGTARGGYINTGIGYDTIHLEGSFVAGYTIIPGLGIDNVISNPVENGAAPGAFSPALNTFISDNMDGDKLNGENTSNF